MGPFEIALVVAAILSALVAGFVLAFASVVMPGIRSLTDRDFLQAFRAMDGVIQRGQPLFMLVWLGSVIALLISGLLGFSYLEGISRLFTIAAAVTYLLGVQLPTAMFNVPLNNWLQEQDLDVATGTAIRGARVRFEDRWVKWNAIRTVFATLTLALLIFVLLRL
jgi:uncharacterized membrane protein